MKTSPSQLALFAADTRFVLLVSSLFSSGLAAELGPTAVVVFLVLRAHANFKTGEVHIGQRRLADQVGVTTLTCRRALTALESRGLISRMQAHSRARTTYTITDVIPVFHNDPEHKAPAGTISVPFIPATAAQLLNDAKASLYRGEAPRGSPITLNITVVHHSGTGDVVVHNHGSSTSEGSTSSDDGFHVGRLGEDRASWFARMIVEASERRSGQDPDS